MKMGNKLEITSKEACSVYKSIYNILINTYFMGVNKGSPPCYPVKSIKIIKSSFLNKSQSCFCICHLGDKTSFYLPNFLSFFTPLLPVRPVRIIPSSKFMVQKIDHRRRPFFFCRLSCEGKHLIMEECQQHILSILRMIHASQSLEDREKKMKQH